MNDKKQSNMESKGKNIPKLRFPGFEGEWEVKKLGEISSVFQGYGFPEKYQGKTNGDIPFYKVSDISFSTDKGNKYILDAKNYIDKETLPLLHAKLIPIGSTIFAKIGEAIRKNNRAITKVPCLIDNNAAAIKAKENISLDEFLFYTMSQIELINYAGGVVPAVTKTAIESIQVPIPTLPEQQKIASCLSSLDGQISAEQSRLESLSQHKRGLMQQLFPQEGETVPKLRFPGFEGDWKVKKLGEIATFIVNNTFSRSELNYEKGDVINIHYGDVLIKFGSILDCSKELLPYITDNGKAKKASHNKLAEGDIVFADTAEDETVGKCTEILNVNGKCIVSGLHTIAIHPTISFSKGYLGHYLNSISYRNQLFKLMQGVKVTSISKSALSSTHLILPTLPEQEKIASCLTAIDKLITAQQERIEALKQHKRGLMQQLFPAVANE